MARVGVVSLGCPKNTIDSESMLGILQAHGHSLVEESQAEVLLINTCTFIEDAQKESIRAILGAGDVKLIVTGCLAQRHKEELLDAMPEISAVLGTGDLGRVHEAVERVLEGERFSLVGDGEFKETASPRVLASIGPSTYLRIAEGCDRPCAFCLIPQLRGPYKSRDKKEILEEARLLAEGGIKEINLVAQDTTLYGSDSHGKLMLPDLLERLGETEGIEWIRLMYAYPNALTPELLQKIKEIPKVLNYLDIPLQHSHPEVLKAMRRPDGEPIDEMVDRLRSAVPGIAIRSTFIVGFPGEEEHHVEHLENFLLKAKLDHVGVFAYSPMDGTPAAEMKQIPKRIRNARRKRLMELQQGISLEINQGLVGKNIEMLVEGVQANGRLVGRTFREAPEIDGAVYATSRVPIEPGRLLPIRVERVAPYDLFGVSIEVAE